MAQDINNEYYARVGSTAWGNLNGSRRTFDDMDQGYLSNVYWHLCMRRGSTDKAGDYLLALEVRDLLDHKFGGVLDYKPWTEREKQQLIDADMVNPVGYVYLPSGKAIGHIDGLIAVNKVDSSVTPLDAVKKTSEGDEVKAAFNSLLRQAADNLPSLDHAQKMAEAMRQYEEITYARDQAAGRLSAPDTFEDYEEVLVNLGGVFVPGQIVKGYAEPIYEVQLILNGEVSDISLTGVTAKDLKKAN